MDPVFDNFLAGRVRTLACSGILLVVGTAAAHHAQSPVYTNEYIEIEGVVAEYLFRNPHVNIALRVTGQDGAETLWRATGPAPTLWQRMGWTDDTVTEGQYLRVTGRMSRTGAPMVYVAADDIRDGYIVMLDPVDRSVVRAIQETANDSQMPDASVEVPLWLGDGRPNLSGTWVNALPVAARKRPSRPPLTQAAAAVQADFDVYMDPHFTECAAVGLVRVATSPLGLRITQHEDRVIIDYEHDAVRRVAYLDGRGPADTAHTPLGHALARYERDALIIESTHLLGSYTSTRGNALSEQTTVTETYRRVDDPEYGAILDLTLVANDPKNLTEAWELGWRKNHSARYDFAGVDCRVPLAPAG